MSLNESDSPDATYKSKYDLLVNSNFLNNKNCDLYLSYQIDMEDLVETFQKEISLKGYSSWMNLYHKVSKSIHVYS
jgi:hypothetical protein